MKHFPLILRTVAAWLATLLIVFPLIWLVIQRLPSAPSAIPMGRSVRVLPSTFGSGKVVMVPLVVIRPIRSLFRIVNHRSPPGPAMNYEFG